MYYELLVKSEPESPASVSGFPRDRVLLVEVVAQLALALLLLPQTNQSIITQTLTALSGLLSTYLIISKKWTVNFSKFKIFLKFENLT